MTNEDPTKRLLRDVDAYVEGLFGRPTRLWRPRSRTRGRLDYRR